MPIRRKRFTEVTVEMGGREEIFMPTRGVADGSQPADRRRAEKQRKGSSPADQLLPVVKARVSSVFCSSSWALAEPVAVLALAERFTDRTGRPPAARSSQGMT